MSVIHSLEDLHRLREKIIQQREARASETQISITVGSCSIAVGARDTLNHILEYVENHHLSGIHLTQTGCVGLCEQEPIVEVTLGRQPKVIYGKVTPQRAERILKEHVLGGSPVKEYFLQSAS